MAVDNSLDAIGQSSDNSIDRRHHADADEGQALSDCRPVFFIATDATHRFCNHHVKPALVVVLVIIILVFFVLIIIVGRVLGRYADDRKMPPRLPGPATLVGSAAQRVRKPH